MDRVGGSLVLAAFTRNREGASILRSIHYVTPSSLGKYIGMLKRKYDIENYIELLKNAYVGAIDCSKFSPEVQRKICTLSAVLDADEGFVLNNDKIAFSSEFNSYETNPSTEDVAVVEQPEIASSELNNTDVTNNNTVEITNKSKKSSGISTLLTILIVLCMLSLVGVILINKIIDGDINGLMNKLKSIEVEISYKAEIESKYNVTLKYTVDANEFCWNGYYGDLKGEEEKVGYAMFDSSGGETVYIEFMSMASYDCSSDIATIIKSFKSKGVKPTEQTTEESK